MEPPRLPTLDEAPVLGGSWVVINRVISRVTMLVSHVRGLITPLITTHEPPSRVKSGKDGRETRRRGNLAESEREKEQI